jgi:hypothetical protein
VNTGFQRLLFRNLSDQLTIPNVPPKEGNLRADGTAVTTRQIIKQHHLLTARVQEIRDYAADVAGAPGYQYCHIDPLGKV